jgi:hypothetical protein
MKTSAFLVAAAAALTPIVSEAQSTDTLLPEDVRATVGVRFWNTDWSTWYSAYEYRHAGGTTPVIGVASVRYKDFLVSGSYLFPHDFQFPDNPNAVRRSEYDVNFGYLIYPGLVATVGWKDINYDSADYRWKTKGVTLGLSGSAALSPVVSMYGNVAYARPKVDDGGVNFSDSSGKYLLTELGLAFPLGQLNSSLAGAVVTAGYRYQRVGAVAKFGTEVFEYTQGPVIGLSFSL